MKIQGLNYRKALTALVALAILVAQNFTFTARAAAPDIDLSNEQRSLSGLLGDLTRLDDLASTLKARGRLTAQDKTRLTSEGENVKRRIVDGTSNIRSAINKLKAAGLWQNLDALVAAKIKSAKLRSFIEQEGGARKLLETAADRINQLRGEIDQSIRDLNAQGGLRPNDEFNSLATGSERLFQGHRILRAGYQPEPSGGGLFRKVFKCLVSATAFIVASAKNSSAGSVQVAEDAFDQNC
jgi:hypothetical protein